METSTASASVQECDWENVIRFEDREDASAPQRDGTSYFRVASLNCLASSYVNPTQMKWLKPHYLAWGHRRKSLVDYILQLDPDLICLQECEDFTQGWSELLDAAGYDFRYQQRPGRMDGCATAWKRSSFNLVECTVVNFNDLGAATRDPKFKRDNIALVLHLRATTSARSLVAANTHIYW